MSFLFKQSFISNSGSGFVRQARKWVLEQYKNENIDLDNPQKQFVTKYYGYQRHDEEHSIPTLEAYGKLTLNKIVSNMSVSELCELLKAIEADLIELGYTDVRWSNNFGKNFTIECKRLETDEEVQTRYTQSYNWDVKVKASNLASQAYAKQKAANQKQKDEAEFERLKAKLGK